MKNQSPEDHNSQEQERIGEFDPDIRIETDDDERCHLRQFDEGEDAIEASSIRLELTIFGRQLKFLQDDKMT